MYKINNIIGLEFLNSISDITFLFGLFMIFVFFIFDRYISYISSKEVLYIGLFSSMFSYPFLNLENGFSENIVFLSLSFVPLLKILSKFCDTKYISFARKSSSVILFLCLVVAALDFTKILHLEESLPFIFIIAFLGFITTIFLSVNIVFNRYCMTSLIYGLVILVVSISYGAFALSPDIVVLGILLFSISAFTSVFKEFTKDYKESVLEYVQDKMLYTDILTTLGNRQAFEKQIKHDDVNISDFKSYWAISIDVNNLKYINNNFGHIQGDKVIQNVADTIDSAFRSVGNCYRIGGDEFIILLKNQTKDGIEKYIELFHSLVSSYNQINDIEISVAIGYDFYKFGYDKSLYDLIARTDSLMCHNKKVVKATFFKSFGEE